VEKLTKIIATIGPASDSPEYIKELINLGVNIFRFNYKHGIDDWHREKITLVKEIREELGKNIGTLLDLQGPEIRLILPVDEYEINKDDEILLRHEFDESAEKIASFKPPEIIEKLNGGQKVLADDGHFVFTVVKKGEDTFLKSHTQGTLLNRKTINIKNFDFELPSLTAHDKEGLELARELGVDFIALSFVRTKGDISELRQEMKKINLEAKIVSKIETFKATENIDEIIEISDAVMIARGDLGVELTLEEVPFYQKQIIKKCVESGVPVITATQMLESMTNKPLPTRAEVSDVTNAVFDLTDAVMLSGETALGKFPLETVSLMSRVVRFAEDKNRLPDIRIIINYDLSSTADMVCDSAFNLYKSLKNKEEDIKGFIVFTHTGKTARMLSRYRMHVPIFAFCPTGEIVRSLSVNYGVEAVVQKSLKQKNEIVKDDIREAMQVLKDGQLCRENDTFIVLHGDYWTSDLGTSTIRLITA